MKKDSFKNVNVVMETNPLILNLLPKIADLLKKGIEPKDILETVFKSWLLVEKSYIDVDVNGIYSIKHAIMFSVAEFLGLDDLPEEYKDDEDAFNTFKHMCELCHDLYVEMACHLEQTKTIVHDIHEIRIKRWLANDIVLEVSYL